MKERLFYKFEIFGVFLKHFDYILGTSTPILITSTSGEGLVIYLKLFLYKLSLIINTTSKLSFTVYLMNRGVRIFYNCPTKLLLQAFHWTIYQVDFKKSTETTACIMFIVFLWLKIHAEMTSFEATKKEGAKNVSWSWLSPHVNTYIYGKTFFKNITFPMQNAKPKTHRFVFK